MSEIYGALRIVQVHPPANATATAKGSDAINWLPEKELVHMLTRRETTIGRALSNDIVLLDSAVSREHVCLVLDQCGWHVRNLSTQNSVCVNGQPVPGGNGLPVQPLDMLLLGSTRLQLIAPQSTIADGSPHPGDEATPLYAERYTMEQNRHCASADGGQGELARDPAFDEGRQAQMQPLTWSAQGPAQSQPYSALSLMHGGEFVSPAHSVLADSELRTQSGEERVQGKERIVQFALPQRVGASTHRLIMGIGVTILATSALVTIILNGLLGLSAVAQEGVLSIVLALAIPLLPALGITVLVHFMDRFEREPWVLRLAAFLWGAIIAIPLALFVEEHAGTILQNLLGPDTSDILRSAVQALNAGVTEETVKGSGLLLLFLLLREKFASVTHGIVYGALIGAGFALVENFSYFAISPRNLLPYLIVGRIIFGWLGHSTFVACFGAALGYVRHTRGRWKQVVIPLLGYLLAVGLHTFFDFIDFQASAAVRAAPGNGSVAFFSLVAIIGDYIPPFLVQMGLLYILMKGLAREAEVIREFLAVEVRNGVVAVREYVLLQNSLQRMREERRILWKRGMRQWVRVKALYQAEIGLAFHKWHVSMEDTPRPRHRQTEDAYRQRIKRLRNEIVAARE